MYKFIVEEEYEQFLQDIKVSQPFSFKRYIDESAYEDEYSQNDIHKAQDIFVNKAKEYLHRYYPGQYIVSCSYCVFIMTPEAAKKHNVSERTIDLFTVK